MLQIIRFKIIFDHIQRILVIGEGDLSTKAVNKKARYFGGTYIPVKTAWNYHSRHGETTGDRLDLAAKKGDPAP